MTQPHSDHLRHATGDVNCEGSRLQKQSNSHIMGHHLRQRVQRKIVHRLQNFQAIIAFLVAVFNSYRLAELLPLVSSRGEYIYKAVWRGWAIDQTCLPA